MVGRPGVNDIHCRVQVEMLPEGPLTPQHRWHYIGLYGTVSSQIIAGRQIIDFSGYWGSKLRPYVYAESTLPREPSPYPQLSI